MSRNNSWIVWIVALIAIVALIVAIIALNNANVTGKGVFNFGKKENTNNTLTPITKSNNGASAQIAPRCSDSDGGRWPYKGDKNYLIPGVATTYDSNGNQIASVSDVCLSSNSLKEAYCDGTNIATETFTCPGQCIEGSCISWRPACIDTDYLRGFAPYYQMSFNANAPPPSQFYVSSYTYTNYNPNPSLAIVSPDTCINGNTMIKEAYCEGNDVSYKSIQCPYGCIMTSTLQVHGFETFVNGEEANKVPASDWTPSNNVWVNVPALSNYPVVSKCLPAPNCVDNDGGLNASTFGVAGSWYVNNEGDTRAIDYCIDNKTVAEAYCENGENAAHKSITCPAGKSCSVGACI